MNKLKASKKDVKENNYRIISAGYCELDYLLTYKVPIAYSAGANGWSCDYYDIDGVIISTGYSPVSDKNVKHDYKLIKSYNDQARRIILGSMNYDDKRPAIEKLLNEFIEKVKI